MRAPFRALAMLLPIGVILAGITVIKSMDAGAATPASGSYVATTPTRLLDTRTGTGATKAPVAGGHYVALQVSGRTPIPTTGVSAVVLNITVTAPTAPGVITAYPDQTARPTASNLNFVSGQTVPNLVVVKLGSNGKVDLYVTSTGTAQLVADVSGYFVAGSPTTQGAFQPLNPARLLDTRNGTGVNAGAVPANGSVAFPVLGQQGVPAAGVSAVVLNVTVTQPTAGGTITAYPDGINRPTASNLNYVKGQTVPNLVVVPVGADGRVALYSASAGTAQLVADVAGYFLAGDPVTSGGFGALAPTRLLDTRSGLGAAKAAVGPNKSVALQVDGRAGVPAAQVRAVVLNVTVTQPTAGGVITAYADATTRPSASNLNYVKGQTVPNLVVAPVGADGKVSLYNSSTGTVQLIADVAGYVLSSDLPVPSTSGSRYVRNITGGSTDAATMQSEGCADAQAGYPFVLLDIGAQTVTAPLSATDPGVRLSATDTRLDYPQLVTAIDGYLDGYISCRSGSAAFTLAVATNNDGDFAGYLASQRGSDWATEVVQPLQTHAGTSATVVGADDIEAGFASTEAQAQQWENSYLAATPASLIFVGSADGCPSTYGATGQTCSYGWTEAQYYLLAHSGSRIQALPQIYVPEQAVQWANIDATGGKQISFLGSLTENAACGWACSLTSSQGWAALWHGLSTISTTNPTLPIATDLKIDG